MDSTPLASIIVPAYNAEAYLGECVRSILAQTCSDYELIIVDDGSTDATGDIAHCFAKCDGRIRIVRQANRGLSAARNAGVDIAKGQFVAFVDADDALHPYFLEYAIGELTKAKADIFSCPFLRIETKDWRELRPQHDCQVIRPADAIEAILYQRKNFIGSACAHVFRAEIVKSERFTEGILYEDLDFFYRAYELAGKITHTDFPFYFYRVNQQSTLHVFKDKRLDVLKVTDRIVTNYCDSPRLRLAAIDRRFAANFNMFVLCARYKHLSKDSCWQVIKTDRLKVLFNSKSRLKNRVGALASLLGQRFVIALSKILYRTS